MKSLNKRMLVATRQVAATLRERDVLRAAVSSRFVVGLHAAFTSEECVHFVLDHAAGGDLHGRLIEEGTLPPSRVVLYAAQVALGLAFLHDECAAVYRDLKPDNVLLDSRGHVLLADFGLASLSQVATSFCGTAEYMAPEVVLGRPYGAAVDWWALGVLVYALSHGGATPFAHENPSVVARKISKSPLELEAQAGDDREAVEFVRALLVRAPEERLGGGGGGSRAVLESAYFASLDLDAVRLGAVRAEWSPEAGRVITSASACDSTTGRAISRALPSMAPELRQLSEGVPDDPIAIRDSFAAFGWSRSPESIET